ncbi:ECF RNA polymerase sigma factor SigJ [Aquisphaera giovannonii]|uniref:ECF RNA polymerase sigma factor SigJ n=1 Tax=Aquisphaera giovannonii TaxID=406548 RepID=A0A5B9WB53_9BACT|nr:sigma-70 family RNA polymerase sigma factor [Aquisphaera giovannonii]QEH37717.1 ECF RNA polymerase sigma factor SigJ [Aquisphaera giovannonii]
MADHSARDAADAFDPHRPALLRVAYRMLGSVADAEDVVQDAFLRWLEADRREILEPAAFLSRVVMRLCLDHLKSARHRREAYVGPWLPEPVVDAPGEEVEDVTLPLLLALERLSPLERAAFLLHDVFGIGFDEVAETIGRGPAACRQLASRARTHVRAARPRFPVAPERGLEIAQAFFAASRQGRMEELRALLAEDVVVHADGGGKVTAVGRPIEGMDAALRLHESLARLFHRSMSRLVHVGFINGLPGFVTVEEGATLQTTALHVVGDRIAAIYVVRNPEKLRHLSGHLS